jgi:Sulfotransferase domain
LYREDLFYADK